MIMVDRRGEFFYLLSMKSTANASRNPHIDLYEVEVRPLVGEEEKLTAGGFLDTHHYLKDVRAVGERIRYGAFDAAGQWLGVLVFCAGSRRLRARDQWIDWSDEQRRRRLPLVVNNCRFLLLPERTVPNLASRVLSLSTQRLSADWQERYGHSVLVVETFVDPEQYSGTLYSASGWSELGKTDGFKRVQRGYYTSHGKPKRLFAKELIRGARRSLAADKLKPSLAGVEAKTHPRPTQSAAEIRSIIGHFKAMPDYRARIGIYPLWSLLAIVFLAHLCGAPRGQKDLEKFAAGLSDGQRRALGIRRRNGKYSTPKQPTFCRLMAGVKSEELEKILLQIQRQVRGEPDPSELINIDGKEPRHGSGDAIVTAVTATTQFYLGSAIVPTQKTNEIPVARVLFEKLDLDGRMVSLDALHTQTETARVLVLEHGADYLFTVKKNQPTLHKTLQAFLDTPPSHFFSLKTDHPARQAIQKPPGLAPIEPPAPTKPQAIKSTRDAKKSETFSLLP